MCAGKFGFINFNSCDDHETVTLKTTMTGRASKAHACHKPMHQLDDPTAVQSTSNARRVFVGLLR